MPKIYKSMIKFFNKTGFLAKNGRKIQIFRSFSLEYFSNTTENSIVSNKLTKLSVIT